MSFVEIAVLIYMVLECRSICESFLPQGAKTGRSNKPASKKECVQKLHAVYRNGS